MNLEWYVARASGLVSWFLLTAGVTWGLVLSTKMFRSRPRPAWTLDIHRFLGGFAVLFTAIHIGALATDRYVHFGLTQLLIPLASRWHPVAVAWGVLGLYLLLAVEGTSLALRALSNRTWKRIHRWSYILFLLVTIHALAAGTDTKGDPIRWVALLASATISFLWLVRVAAGGARRNQRLPGGMPQKKPAAAGSGPM